MPVPQGNPTTAADQAALAGAQAAQAGAEAAQAAQAAEQAAAARRLFQQLQNQGSPSELYQAARAARRELENQLDNYKQERFSIAQRLRQGGVDGADLKGLETRLIQIDARITALDKQIEQADAAVARAAAIPGAAVDPPRLPRQGPPEEVFVLGGMFIFVVLLPISVAYARRIWRKSAAMIMMKPHELNDRFTRLEQSLDSIAVEVERVGESQRFLTRMQAQQQERALGAGPAERVGVDVGERETVRRK